MSQIHWLLYASSVNFAPFHKMCHSFEASAQKLLIDVTGRLSVSVVADPLQIHVLSTWTIRLSSVHTTNPHFSFSTLQRTSNCKSSFSPADCCWSAAWNREEGRHPLFTGSRRPLCHCERVRRALVATCYISHYQPQAAPIILHPRLNVFSHSILFSNSTLSEL